MREGRAQGTFTILGAVALRIGRQFYLEKMGTNRLGVCSKGLRRWRNYPYLVNLKAERYLPRV